MRALVYNGPWQLGVEERPDPRPGPDEVLVRVTATGICGSDLHGFTGENGRRHPGQVMGHEFVGTVVGVGDAVVDGPAEGDVATAVPVIACQNCPACARGEESMCPNKRVIGVDPTISSAFAELVAVPARNVVTMPADMPAELGALVEPLAVGYHAANRGGVSAGQCVLVVGGGPIGQACFLAAQHNGATDVVVTEIDVHRRRLLDEVGADVVDPSATDDVATAVGERLGGSADVVIDAVGADATVAQALACAAEGGTVVLVGMQSPTLTVDAYAVSTKQRNLVGAFCYSHREFRETASWVATGPEQLTRLIEGRVDLDAAPAAFESLAKHENPASKILVFPQGLEG